MNSAKAVELFFISTYYFIMNVFFGIILILAILRYLLEDVKIDSDSIIQEFHAQSYRYCKDVDASKSDLISKQDWTGVTCVPQMKSALDLYEEECLSGTILSVNKELDEALGGGVCPGIITEFCGEPGCGKTQICFYLCVNVQLPLWCGGMEGKCVYINTNKSFAAHRLKEIATARVDNYNVFKTQQTTSDNKQEIDKFNVESILDNINCIDIKDYVELIAVIKYLEGMFEENTNSIRLIIIDSISAPLKLAIYEEKSHVIYSIFRDLQKLALKHKFAIVLTNDITTRIRSASTTYHTPSLGGSYYHRINTRVELTKIAKNEFRADIKKSVLGAPVTIDFNLFS